MTKIQRTAFWLATVQAVAFMFIATQADKETAAYALAGAALHLAVAVLLYPKGE